MASRLCGTYRASFLEIAVYAGSPRSAEMKKVAAAGLGRVLRLYTPSYIYMLRADGILGIDGRCSTADEGLGSALSEHFPETNHFDV